MATSLKITRPNRLSNEETLTSFEDWKNNLIFYLSQDKDFMVLLKEETKWKKIADADPHRGRTSAGEKLILDRFLGVIASLSPPLLYHDIIDDTTCISDVFRLLRGFYQSAPSESTFMKYFSIKREVVNGSLERPLHLFLRMKQFIRDNLLLSSGKIEHDGKIPTSNEHLSPTTERLNVLRWLEVLHPSLPNHVSNVFSQDLQTKSLKDLQPRICEQIDDLLRNIEDKGHDENLSASYSRFNSSNHHKRRKQFSHDNYKKSYNNQQPPFQKPRSNTLPSNVTSNQISKFKTCEVCRSLNLPFVGHNIYSCPNVSPSDRAAVLKSCAIEVEGTDDYDEYHVEQAVEVNVVDRPPQENEAHVNLDIFGVCVMRSPAFSVKINHVSVSAVIDSGATGSMIQLNIVEMANLTIYPSKHTAEQADGFSNLRVVGEVHTNIVLDDDLVLPITAIVVTSLKEDILIGIPFMKRNKMVIDFGSDSIRVKGREIFFKDIVTKPKTTELKATISRVVFPGESVDFQIPANFIKDREVAIEPRDNLAWPSPQI